MKTLFAALAIVLLAGPYASAQSSDSKSAPVANASASAASEQLTVEGPVAKVVAKKKEIYVQGADKKYEFYFKPTTELVKGGSPVDFSTLAEGTKVRVTYVKVGKRTDPVKVEVLQ